MYISIYIYIYIYTHKYCFVCSLSGEVGLDVGPDLLEAAVAVDRAHDAALLSGEKTKSLYYIILYYNRIY